MDVTKPLLFNGLEYIYGEHFLEHLSLERAIAFLDNVWKSLKLGGVIRLYTHALEWGLSIILIYQKLIHKDELTLNFLS